MTGASFDPKSVATHADQPTDAHGDAAKPVPLTETGEATDAVVKRSIFKQVQSWFSSKPSKVTQVPKAKIKALSDGNEAHQVKEKTDRTTKSTENMTKGWKLPSWNWSFKTSALGRWLFKPKDAAAPKEATTSAAPKETASTTATKETTAPTAPKDIAVSKAEATVSSEVSKNNKLLDSGTAWLCSQFFAEREMLKGVDSPPDTSKIVHSMLADLMSDRSPKYIEDHQFAAFITVKDPPPSTISTRQFIGFYSSKEKAELAKKLGSKILEAQGKELFPEAIIQITNKTKNDKRTLVYKGTKSFEKVNLSHFAKNMVNIFGEMAQLNKSASTAPAQSGDKSDFTRARSKLLDNLPFPPKISIQPVESAWGGPYTPPVSLFLRNLADSFSTTPDIGHPHALMATKDGEGVCLGYFEKQSYANGMLEFMSSVNGISDLSVTTADEEGGGVGKGPNVDKSPFELLFEQNKEELAYNEIRMVIGSFIIAATDEVAEGAAKALISDYRKERDAEHPNPVYIQKRTPEGTLKDELLGYYPTPDQAKLMAGICKRLLTKGDNYYYNLKESEALGEKPETTVSGMNIFDRLARARISSDVQTL